MISDNIQKLSKKIIDYFNTFHFYDSFLNEIELQSFIETIFLLSISHEERQELICRITFTDDNSEDYLSKDILKFSEVIPFSISDLRKLALSSNIESSQILVRKKNEVKLEVYGLCKYTNNEMRLNDDNVDLISMYKSLTPQLFTVLIKEPGVLSLSCGDSELFLLKNDGIFENQLISIFSATYSVLSERLNKIRNQVLSKAMKSFDSNILLPQTNYYDNVIISILEKMVQIRHGGTLIISVGESSETLNAKIKYKVMEKSYGNDGRLYRDIEDVELKYISQQNGLLPKELSSYSVYKRVSSYVDLISQLSAVDGAVLLSEKLDILGYGVFFDLNQDKIDELKSIDYDTFAAEGKEVVLSFKEYGTRHKSALNFCMKNNAVAFVVSQDGDITCIGSCGNLGLETTIGIQKNLRRIF